MTIPDYPDETALLEELVRMDWTLYAVGEGDPGPALIVAVKHWQLISDVIAIRGFGRVTAYRTVTTNADPLYANFVIWHYAGHTAYALDQISRLHGSFGAPYPIPPECRIPDWGIKPFVMRAPQHLQRPDDPPRN